jgi:hypothetical protein
MLLKTGVELMDGIGYKFFCKRHHIGCVVLRKQLNEEFNQHGEMSEWSMVPDSK